MTEPDTVVDQSISDAGEPFGIFTDVLFRPRRFFARATGEHLVEGAKVGVVAAVLGFLLGVVTNVGLNWVTQSAEGAPVDETAVWGIPFTLAVIGIALAVEFLVAVGFARLLRGKGSIEADALAFCCSLAPTILWAVPLVGALAAPIYQVVVFGRGLAGAERVSAARGTISAIIGIAVTFVMFVAALYVLVSLSIM